MAFPFHEFIFKTGAAWRGSFDVASPKITKRASWLRRTSISFSIALGDLVLDLSG